MSEYRPDNWVVIKMTRQQPLPSYGARPSWAQGEHNHEVTYKVLAGWNPGYLDGESWRMNSGVDFIVDHKDEVHFHGRSGSNYICGKGQYGMRRNGSSIFERMTKESESMDIDVTLLDKDTDWIKLLR